MKSLDLLAFDMDGVLADTSPCHAHAYDVLWQTIGITGPAYEDIAGRTTREVIIAQTAHLLPDRETIQQWVELKQKTARHILQTNNYLFNDTHEAIETLCNDGFRLMVVTGASRASCEIILEMGGIREFFSDLVCAEDVTRGKPDPQGYHLAMQHAGCSEQETLIVEDSQSGIDAALASQAMVVSVRSELTSAAPNFLFSYVGLTECCKSLREQFRVGRR